MRKLYRPFCFIAAVAAMSLTSCQKESFTPGTEEGTVITVHATVEDVANATKTHIDGTQVYWDQEEQMKVVSFDSAAPETSGKESNSSSFAPSADYTTATFTVTVNNEAANTIAGVYPASAAKGLQANGNASSYKVELPANQIATANSYDPAAYIMITRPQTLPVENNEWNAYYIRAAALTRMEVSGLNDDIKSVTVTFPEGQYAAGRRYFDLAASTAGEIYNGQTNEITVSYTEPLAAGTTQNVWFTSWNVDVAAGETVTVKIQSDTKIYTKTFTATKAISLKENFLNIMPVDMTGASEEDASDFSGEYLIVSKDEKGTGNWVYMSDIYSNNNYFTIGTTNISATSEFSSLSSKDFYSIPNIDKHVWTVSKVEGGYTILNDSEPNNIIYLEPDNDSNDAHASTAPITVYIGAGDNGTVKIQANSTNNRWLQYNMTSPRFACYNNNNQQDIYLLPWVESTDPMLSVSQPEQTVAADAESVSFTYTARNITGAITAVEGTDDSNIISAVSVDEASSTVNVTLTPNTEDVEKTATITLSAEGVEPITLKITQSAKVSGLIKFVGFEYEEGYKAGNNYQGDHSQGDWTIIQGAVTTTSSAVISGEQSLQLRGYANQTESYITLKDNATIIGVTYITFKAKQAKKTPNIKISYKIGSGEWSSPEEITLSNNAEEYTYIISSAPHSEAVNIKFESTTPGTKDTQLSIDDIAFYQSTPSIAG